MFKALKFVAVALATLLVAEPAVAQFKPRTPGFILRRLAPPIVRPPLPLLMLPIQPSEAAAIAQGQYPGSKVLKVKLLPDGIYAVTLVTEDSVSRVMVDGHSGELM